MRSLRLLLPFLLLSSVLFAQDHPTVTAQPNTVYVGADGKYEAAPDTAQIQFNVSVQEDTAQAAFQRASKNVDQVREVLRANGIDPKSANIGFLSVQPVYDYRNPKQKLIGYRVTTDVTLKLKDFSKVGPVTQQLADATRDALADGTPLALLARHGLVAVGDEIDEAYVQTDLAEECAKVAYYASFLAALNRAAR